MFGRASTVITSGVDPLGGIVFALCLGAAAMLIGSWRFSRMDILSKEYES
ncbi:hypothetical protein K6V98_03950 [Collinsella sp. AGMB00827]|uniref:Uncharacterized protein n=1 Tax=Collinsella ureilytica TaxID=2869515 RepID=A0ABS7MM60_9ACTN|nr:hypothetical protein [Collinsella urealyticum]MBY4797510.1 hypothetical protein [Collinsella urealyticum]